MTTNGIESGSPVVAMPQAVKSVFDSYPKRQREALLSLRSLIFEVAGREGIKQVEETLKWGEPSYGAKGGSPVRLAWKSAKPDEFGVYVNCQSRLLDTYRELYGEVFRYEGNRAMVFNAEEPLPLDALEHCFKLALTYHSRKKLPLLGA